MAILNNTPEFKPAEVVVAEELLDSYLHDPNGWGYYILVAEAEEKVAGYICYGPTLLTEGTWDIYWIAVAAEKQNQGVGCALMSSAEANIGRAKGRLVLVETSSKPNYEKTRRFYQKLGYEVVSRIPDFYEPGDDKITLQKLFPR
jgi:ribosomal protein S18 acetylase RimI-like enzyme